MSLHCLLRDEIEGSSAETDEAALAVLRSAAAPASDGCHPASGLEGAIVFRIAQKHLLDGCLRDLAGKSTGKAAKRKR